ncbi:MAG: SDR family oxidoreductase [Beutenbergiaceae bacterium]
MTDSKPLVVVTGASSGIGAATATAFARRGYPLLITARRRDRLEQLDLPNTRIAAVDVADTEAMSAAIDAAVQAHGPVDLLVNNAGLMPLGTVAQQDPAQWRQLFEINVLALLQLTRIVLPDMIARRHGTIMNLGSVAGRNIYDNHTVYNGTKFAVHAISEGLRREVAGHNVRVSVIAPGQIATELLQTTTSEQIRDDYLAYRDSIGGALDASHVADVIVSTYELPQQVCVREIVLAPTAQDA